MKIFDLKPGQPVTIDGIPCIYKGVNKINTKIGKVQKIVFQGEGKFNQRLYPITDGTKTLKSEKIELIK